MYLPDCARRRVMFFESMYVGRIFGAKFFFFLTLPPTLGFSPVSWVRLQTYKFTCTIHYQNIKILKLKENKIK
uniref:SFRICE_039654 n=1 Tax=Spodoptera frugiperda TaxID=7108 RepID=A0A2H1WLB3_SPOFR